MKTTLTMVMAVVTALIVMACNNGLSDSRGMSSKGMNERPDRSQRTTIDAAKYIDFTVKEYNAAKYTKQDVMYELSGAFKIAGGNSYITINRVEGSITLSSDDAWHNGSGGHNMYAKYAFDVQAANENCLYLKMGAKHKAQFLIDSEAMSGQSVPDLAVCVPLYGFSRNRIEVSPVMDGYIAMPSGTYWAVKK